MTGTPGGLPVTLAALSPAPRGTRLGIAILADLIAAGASAPVSFAAARTARGGFQWVSRVKTRNSDQTATTFELLDDVAPAELAPAS
jgi:hypothetical protein